VTHIHTLLWPSPPAIQDFRRSGYAHAYRGFRVQSGVGQKFEHRTGFFSCQLAELGDVAGGLWPASGVGRRSIFLPSLRRVRVTRLPFVRGRRRVAVIILIVLHVHPFCDLHVAFVDLFLSKLHDLDAQCGPSCTGELLLPLRATLIAHRRSAQSCCRRSHAFVFSLCDCPRPRSCAGVDA
jgi:hypothetical protein